ncbi:MAG TPA: PAS domain S-box protein [Sphingomicrobium sp.]|nr:PAS domain S-box protein [Sphingomicrobium sp.]
MNDKSPLARPAMPDLFASDALGLVADSVICTDEGGQIILFNRAAEETFGYPTSEVVGEHIEMLLPQQYRVKHAGYVRSFASEAGAAHRIMGHRREVCGRRRNGEDFPAEATVSRQSVRGRTLLTVAVRDISERKALERQRDTVARELDHRVRNLLSVVNSLVSLTARGATSVGEFRDSLLDRLAALARTQSALRYGAKQSTSLRELLGAELAQYRADGGANIHIEGPSVPLGQAAAQSLALAFHELATNSAKYGALSRLSGKVEVVLSFSGVKDSQVNVRWRETGGPAVTPPSKLGFGTALIKEVIERSFQARVTLEYAPDGVVCDICLPRAKVEPSRA